VYKGVLLVPVKKPSQIFPQVKIVCEDFLDPLPSFFLNDVEMVFFFLGYEGNGSPVAPALPVRPMR
jgi:hypothetical protein